MFTCNTSVTRSMILPPTQVLDAAFFSERMRQDATLRKLQVIGEAVKSLSDAAKSQQPHIPWKQVAGLRDKVIHDYFGVNLHIIWAVVEKDLPALRKAIDHLLSGR